MVIALALLIALCCCATAYFWRRSKRQGPLAASQGGGWQQGEGALPLVVANPLVGGLEGAAAPAARERGAWKKCREGQDVWWVHRVTGEAVWELPKGEGGAGLGAAEDTRER